MKDKIKTTINKTPKFVSLVILANGYVFAVRELANSDPYLTGVAIVSAVLLLDKASK